MSDAYETVSLLGDLDEWSAWRHEWQAMPEYAHEDLEPWRSLLVHFANRTDMEDFARTIGQPVTERTQSLWHPKAEIGRCADKRYASATPWLPRYPVYVISKGRWDSRLTSKALEAIRVPYSIVVEPQEFEDYAAVIDAEKILALPFSNLGKGSIPARNWVWDHAIQTGAERHWILDDNIGGFYRYNYNLKTPVADGTIFRAAEDFVDRYENVAEAGFNYFMFVSRKSKPPPFYLNTRIYSCILLRNDLPYRWRGRYNEDTDLSLRILKDGWATVLFNAFLAAKAPTMSMRGGNTDDLYAGDGRRAMAESLAEQHPDVARVGVKWGRYQHQVDYSPFRGNRLRRRDGVEVREGVDDYGMRLEERIGGFWTSRDRRAIGAEWQP